MVKCLYVTASKANYQTNNWIKYKNRDTQSTEYLLSNLACGWTNKYASWYPFDSILLDINWQFWPYFFVLLLAVIKASYDKLYRDHLGKKKKKKVCWRLLRLNHKRQKTYLSVKLVMLKGFCVPEFVTRIVKIICLAPYNEFCYFLLFYVAFFLQKTRT